MMLRSQNGNERYKPCLNLYQILITNFIILFYDMHVIIVLQLQTHNMILNFLTPNLVAETLIM